MVTKVCQCQLRIGIVAIGFIYSQASTLTDIQNISRFTCVQKFVINRSDPTVVTGDSQQLHYWAKA